MHLESMLWDYLSGDYLETLGIDNFFVKRPVARKRGIMLTEGDASCVYLGILGLNPKRTEAEIKYIESSIATKLEYKAPKGVKNEEGEPDEYENFNINSSPRVVLHEGKVNKKTFNSVMSTSSKKHLILMNDVLLITSVHSSGTLKKVEKYHVNHAIPLDKCTLPLFTKENVANQFELLTPGKTYTFVVEREDDKRIWVEELSEAIVSVHADAKWVKCPGWQHELLTGTIHSAALLGDEDMLRYHIQPNIPLCTIKFTAYINYIPSLHIFQQYNSASHHKLILQQLLVVLY